MFLLLCSCQAASLSLHLDLLPHMCIEAGERLAFEQTLSQFRIYNIRLVNVNYYGTDRPAQNEEMTQLISIPNQTVGASLCIPHKSSSRL